MHTRIPEMRDPSKWKFPKRGIPLFRNSKTRESIHFCSFLQEISSFYKCFSVLNWDSQFQNFIEEFQCLQCMSNIGLLITFHTATSGAICWPSSQAIPRFGNFYFEGSLVLEISILRDPSFQEFWDRYEINRFFRRSNSVFRPDFSIQPVFMYMTRIF